MLFSCNHKVVKNDFLSLNDLENKYPTYPSNEEFVYQKFEIITKNSLQFLFYRKEDSLFIYTPQKENSYKLSYSGLNFINERDKKIDTILENKRRNSSFLIVESSQSGQQKDTLVISKTNGGMWNLDSLISYSKIRNDPNFMVTKCVFRINKNMKNITIEEYFNKYKSIEQTNNNCTTFSLLPYIHNSRWKEW